MMTGRRHGVSAEFGPRFGRIAEVASVVMVSLLVAGGAWAYWTVASVAGGNTQATATTVGAGATPTATPTQGTVVVNWTASVLANAQAVSGYTVTRYNVSNVAQSIGGNCTGLVTALTCTETTVPTGAWKYSITPRFATNWVGTESAKSSTVVVDATAPSNVITATVASGAAFKSGNTVYYRGVVSGSFTLTNALTDANSGPASSTTAALGGTTTGWTHSPSTVATPSGGPYVSAVFSWGALTTTAPTVLVTGTDVAGNTTGTTVTFTNDSTAPSAGSVSYLDGYQPARSVPVTFTTGTDAGSGIASRQLQRSYAALTSGTCGTYSNFVNLGSANPTSPYTDTAVYTGACYKYQYVVTDAVGNQSITTSASVSKIDYGAAIGATTGLLSWWRFGETAITSTDRFTDTAGTSLTSHTSADGTTWTRRTGDTATAVLAGGDRVRLSTTGGAAFYTDETPASADYLVEADVKVNSLVAGDLAGVVGRLNPTGAGAGTYYTARYYVDGGRWDLYYMVEGVGFSAVGSYTQALTVGQTYRVGLLMQGSTISLLVDGVVRVTGTSAAISTAGHGGIRLNSDTTVPTDTTGLSVDNFVISPIAADSKGSNPGSYHNGVTLGVAGITGDNTAATFDSSFANTVQTQSSTSLPTGAATRSVEMWFKTPGLGAGQARQALFSYGSGVAGQEFGVWLEANGTQIKFWDYNVEPVQTWAANFNDNQWHQFVVTYDGTAVRMYVDGVLGGTDTVTLNTVIGPSNVGIGGIVEPGLPWWLAPASYFNGALDEVSFYSSVLDLTTIQNHYSLGSGAVADTSGPTGGSVDASGLAGTGSRYSQSTALSIAFNKGSDPSGLAASGAQLLRATATLTSTGGADGVCGTYGSYSQVGANDPASTVSDVVSDQACYKYRYVVQDALGNSTTYTSGDIKVDSTVPSTPSLSFSAFTNTYWPGSGTTVYYRSSATPGSFTATATATDAASGVVSYSFPSLGTNWTSTPGALGVNTYSWSGSPAAPGTSNVTATNNAGGTSANSSFTLTADNTAPSAGTVTYVNGSTGGGTVSVSFTTGTDGGSGLGTRLLQRAAAPLTGMTCGTYGAFATVSGGTNPTSPVVDAVAATGFCYTYRYLVSDNLGNTDTATSASVAHTPYGAHYSFNEGAGTSAADSFGNSNTGTLQTGATWTTPKIGASALNLDGTTGAVEIAGPVIDSSESYTVATWVKLNNLTGFQTFAAIEGTNISPFFLEMRGGVFTFAQRGSDAWDAALVEVTGAAPVVGRWYYVAGVYDKAANTAQLYVDGVLQGSATAAAQWRANGRTVIGRAWYFGGPVDYVNGALDETRFYDRALTASEIVALGGYQSAVNSTAGLVNYWHLDQATTTSDTFAGTSGATLQSRNGEIGATWSKLSAGWADAVLTDSGRVRKSTNSWGALYYSSGVPTSANYRVEADIYVASNLNYDGIGVIGRVDTSNTAGSFYIARYQEDAQAWEMYAVVNNSWTWLGSYGQTLTVGSSYRVALDMVGSTISMSVDGVQRVSVTDITFTAAGRGGFLSGQGTRSTNVTNTTGLHLDNFVISPLATDSVGTNNGFYANGVTLSAAGVMANDSNTAATFDGVNDYVTAARQISGDLSVELWFKTTQNFSSNPACTYWGQGASLVDNDSAGVANDFGLSVCSGRIAVGVGNPDVSVITSGTYNDGAWHQVVMTRTQATGLVTLYVDGAPIGTVTGNTNALTAQANVSFGRSMRGDDYFAGSMDEVSFYNTALSAATVAAHYNAR